MYELDNNEMYFYLKRLVFLLCFFTAAALTAQDGGRYGYIEAGDFLFYEYEFAKARAEYERAMGAEDTTTALAHHKVGLTYYYESESEMAAAAYREAIRIRDAILPPGNLDAARSRRNLGAALIDIGQLEEAGTVLREAIASYEDAPVSDTLNWVRSLVNLLDVTIELRDYQVAMSAAASTASLLGRVEDIPLRTRQAALYTIAHAYYLFDHPQKALPLARQALGLAEELGSDADVLEDLNLLSVIYAQLDQYPRQIEIAERAIRLSETQDEVDSVDLGLLHLSLARAYGRIDRIGKARLNADFALELLSGSQPAWQPMLHTVRGELALQSGDKFDALEAYNEGLRCFHAVRPGALPRPHPDSLSDHQLAEATQLLGVRASLLTSSNQPLEALADYELLFLLEDRQREGVSFDDSRAYLSQQIRPYFDRAIDLLTTYAKETGDEEYLWDAFTLSERAKAYSLLKSLQQDRGSRNAQETKLRMRIAELERLAALDDRYVPSLESATLQLDRMLHTRQKKQFSEVREPIGRDIVDLLRQHQKSLVAFHLGEGSGHLFVIDPANGNLEHRVVYQMERLGSRVAQWRAAIKESAYRRKSLLSSEEQSQLDLRYTRGAYDIYRNLFGELALPAGNLVIVPDGPLSILPFSCLLTSAVDGEVAYGRLPYLSNDRTITYAYSAEILRELERPVEENYELDLLAFAPSFSGTATPSGERSLLRSLREGERSLPGLSPLKFNLEEVRGIARVFPDHKLYSGLEANRENFLADAGRARIVHLSTHGMVDATDPRLSFVAFSQLSDSLELEEMLYFSDLSALDLRAEMAVLSACETSLGEYQAGEHTLSLASAFTAAGAKSTLTTLWQVDDEATSQLMESFYKSLADGLTRDQALANAQIAQRSLAEFEHPYYWAGLSLYGQAGTLVPAGGKLAVFWWILGGLLLLLTIAGFVVFRKQMAPNEA